MSDEELIKQANALFEQNKFKEAKCIYYQVLSKYTPENYEYVLLCINLVEILMRYGCYAELEEVLNKAIKAQITTFGEQSEQMVTLYRQLGTLYEDANKLDQAHSLYKQALDISKLLDPNSRSMVESLNSLGTLYQKQQNFHESESCLLQACTILKSTPEIDPNTAALVFNNLMNGYINQKRFGDAITIGDHILRLQGADDDYQDVVQSNLAAIYQMQGKYDLAEEILIKMLERCKRKNAPELRIADAYSDLGTVYLWQRKFDQAKYNLEQGKNIYLRYYVPEHQRIQLSEAMLVEINNMLNHSCSACGILSHLICGKCKRAYYCSLVHQREDWKSHKPKCYK